MSQYVHFDTLGALRCINEKDQCVQEMVNYAI